MHSLLNHRAKIFVDSNTVLFSEDKRLTPKEKMEFAVSTDTTVLDSSTGRYGRFLNLSYGIDSKALTMQSHFNLIDSRRVIHELIRIICNYLKIYTILSLEVEQSNCKTLILE